MTSTDSTVNEQLADAPFADGRLGYDIIGDPHGNSEKLLGILAKLGYLRDSEGVFTHAQRRAIFVGDLIDRGPNQLEVLETVKAMVDAGRASAVMGNHEFNALGYATPDPAVPGEFCRPHIKRNRVQHSAFLEQLTAVQREYFLGWFRSLPLWLDLGDVRVVHACWNEAARHVVQDVLGCRFLSTTEQIVMAFTKGTPLYDAVDTLLKGPELDLRDFDIAPFVDKDGRSRNKARIRWWARDTHHVRDLVVIPPDVTDSSGQPYPEIGLSHVVATSKNFTLDDHVPVFYGHYWRVWDPRREGFHDWRPATPDDWTPQAACVDFGAAGNGPLVAYRWNKGDTVVRAERFVAYR